MKSSLQKAMCHSAMIAEGSFESGMNTKQGGVSMGDVMPSGVPSALVPWQDQMENEQRYSLMRGWVYAAVHALASEGAGQEPLVAQLKSNRKRGRLSGRKAYLLKKMPESLRRKASKVEWEILEDHELNLLLEQPNPIQGKWQFVYSFIANLCLTGWSYVVIGASKTKDGKGNQLELYCLPTSWVTPVHEEGPFSQIKVTNPKAVGKEPVILERGQFGFAHLPDPSDPLSALSPTSTQLISIRVDDHIQTSQEAFFRNGIFPSVILTVGKMPFTDVDGKPVLTGMQREQVFSAVRKIWGGVANHGKPAIVDGLIEKIERLSATQNEMGWQRSEEKVRTRILSAYGVHPYLLGEAVSVGGYAQVANIEKRFYKRVNTFLDMLSNLLTNLVGPLGNEDQFFVGIEKCEVIDPSLRQGLLMGMRQAGDITQNEIRAEAGFPPDEDGNEAEIPGSLAGAVAQVVALIGGGQATPEQGQAMLEGMGLPTDTAKKIAGVGGALPPALEAPPEPEPEEVKPDEEGEGKKPKKPEEEEDEEIEVDDEVQDLAKELRRTNDLWERSIDPDATADGILDSCED